MEYIIHHLELIEPPTQRSFFEDEVRKKISRIEKVLRQYRKEVLLELFLKKEGNLFVITASLALLEKILTVEEEGFKPVAVINFVFDTLKNLVARQLQVERKEHLYKRKNKVNNFLENTTTSPAEQEKPDKKSFAQFIQKIFPEIEQYIKNEIRRKPVLARLTRKRMVEMDEIVDKIYLHLYTELEKKPDIGEKLVLWAFSLAGRKINELDEKYALKKLVSTEPLTNEEMRQMEEELTANADTEPVLAEDVDENSFGLNGFDLPEILADAGIEEDIINKTELDDKENDINRILQQLPGGQRSIFELYYLYRFSIPEIGQINNMRIGKVDELLQTAREQFTDLVKETTDHRQQATRPGIRG